MKFRHTTFVPSVWHAGADEQFFKISDDGGERGYVVVE
jgi:hypothetical protein